MRSSNVRHSNRAIPCRHRRDELVVLHDIDELRARRANRRPAHGAGRGARERDAPEVREGHEAIGGAEVLDDPLRIVLAQRGLSREAVRDRLARRLVRDLRRAARGGGSGDGDGDGVARGEADPGEVVRVVGVPLVPC